jgi:hypothetical protein
MCKALMTAPGTQPILNESLIDQNRGRHLAALWNFPLAVTDTPASPSGVIARLRDVLGGTNEASITRRLAGTIFIIRVVSAGLAYFAQVLLARWLAAPIMASMSMSGPGCSCSAA